MMKRLKDKKGIALMMVLGSVVILSTMIVEFAYNSHVSYELAASERDRLKAYYLARSAYNLIRLELRFEKDIRARYASMLKDMKGQGVTADPLCKQVPLSTGILKGISTGDLFGGGEKKEGEEGGEEAAAEEKAKDEKAPIKPGSLESLNGGGKPEVAEGAEEFLNFDGDFEVTCDTEERRLNLNIFRMDPLAGAGSGGSTSADPALTPYESQKNLLFSLMSQKDFEPIFKGKPDEIRKVVNAIADWADRDDRVNESPGVSGGSEDSEYASPDIKYKVKNGRFMTPGEILLVSGVGDDLYQKLEPQLTVFGDAKINLCQASDEMVKAFVQRYVSVNPSLAPISPNDDEKWLKIIEATKFACTEASPTPDGVAGAIAPLIGAPDTKGMASQITTTNRFYRIEASSTVGENSARIMAVIDAGSNNPNSWKTLYFRVE